MPTPDLQRVPPPQGLVSLGPRRDHSAGCVAYTVCPHAPFPACSETAGVTLHPAACRPVSGVLAAVFVDLSLCLVTRPRSCQLLLCVSWGSLGVVFGSPTGWV